MALNSPKKDEDEVLRVYKRVNPSTYFIESSEEEFVLREQFLTNLYTYRLTFPPKMFEGMTLLEFGSGTGEHSLFYLKWGAHGTFVEMNDIACDRARKLFKFAEIAENRYEIVNSSLFDYAQDRKFDLVISSGVIHHTGDKRGAFSRKAAHLKPGGFLILGVGNSSGLLQRNIQRYLLYSLSSSEEDIVRYANILFGEHLDRAVKFGRRSREAIIFDSYINPKVDTPRIADVLSWFDDNNLRLYSSWPPIVPSILADPVDRRLVEHGSIVDLLSIPEIAFLCHAEDDADVLSVLNGEAASVVDPVSELVDLFAGVTPTSKIDLDLVIDVLRRLSRSGSDFNPLSLYHSRLRKLVTELHALIDILKTNDVSGIEKCITSCRVLFSGTCGLGMTWFVGHKMQ